MPAAHRDAPGVPVKRLRAEGWERTGDVTRERRFGAGVATERTVVYADADLRARVEAATGDDGAWRFFFASSLAFDPPLPPVTGAASVRPTVARETRDAFEFDRRERGVRRPSRRRERARVDSGDRASLYPYRGTLVGDAELDVAAWLAVWTTGGDCRLAGGGYPERLPAGVEGDPTAYRKTLLQLVRAVE